MYVYTHCKPHHSSTSSRPRKTEHLLNMSPLLVTVLGLVATTHAIPQGYGQSGNLGIIPQTPKPDFNPGKTPNLPAGCSIQYKTVNVIVEVEEFTTKCEQRYR